VGTFLGASVALALRRDEPTIQRWAVRGSIFGGTAALSARLATLLPGG